MLGVEGPSTIRLQVLGAEMVLTAPDGYPKKSDDYFMLTTESAESCASDVAVRISEWLFETPPEGRTLRQILDKVRA